MPDRTDVVYRYDGSYEGVLCCIFESFLRKETPAEILPETASQTTLFDTRDILTDETRAARVIRGLKARLPAEAVQLVEWGYYIDHPHKESLILSFVKLSMRVGREVLSMLTHDTVRELQRAVGRLSGESHQLKGFTRFSVHDGVMTAVIEPKNFVLPLLAPHFCDRFAGESFLIYDKTHKAALIYSAGKARIIPVDSFEAPPADACEQRYRLLWKTFYDTIAIRERENPRCRMSHMPKRYWRHLTEMAPAPAQTLPERRRTWDVLGEGGTPAPFPDHTKGT